MKNTLFKLKQQYGITLIEILVAILITGIITTLGLQVYLTQHKTYLWQEQLSDMNMNAQFAMGELSKRISYAGYGMPEGPIFFVHDGTTDIITSIIAGNNDPNPDEITIISKSPIHGAFGLVPFGVGINDVGIICEGCKDSIYFDPDTYDSIDIEAGDFALIADWNTTTTEIFPVTIVNQPVGAYSGISRTPPWQIAYTSGSHITKVEFHKFYLNADSLMLETRSDPDTVVIAQNVDSLNFTYTYHLASGTTTLDTPIPFVPIKAVNVRLTVRTTRMKKDVYGSSDMDTGYSYKTLSNTIKVKNKGFRSFYF